jgi:hypothetical protein
VVIGEVAEGEPERRARSSIILFHPLPSILAIARAMSSLASKALYPAYMSDGGGSDG